MIHVYVEDISYEQKVFMVFFEALVHWLLELLHTSQSVSQLLLLCCSVHAVGV